MKPLKVRGRMMTVRTQLGGMKLKRDKADEAHSEMLTAIANGIGAIRRTARTRRSTARWDSSRRVSASARGAVQRGKHGERGHLGHLDILKMRAGRPRSLSCYWINDNSHALDMIQKRTVLDVSQRLHFKAVRQWQFIEFRCDRLGTERLDIACHHEIDIRAVAVGALGA